MTTREWVHFLATKREVEEWYLGQGIKAWVEGANYGKDAGQSREHFHYHYFDRVAGDVKDPRGGIRNFKPPIEELGNYKDET